MRRDSADSRSVTGDKDKDKDKDEDGLWLCGGGSGFVKQRTC